ncbi:hypothetical protein V1477_016256 [Vespula maculifrons]|uniref:Uncharacterized protein n=1 Tax=Vespula maculifrons TaxID=7453 RepID=A0ABD2BCI4_VESMC
MLIFAHWYIHLIHTAVQREVPTNWNNCNSTNTIHISLVINRENLHRLNGLSNIWNEWEVGEGEEVETREGSSQRETRSSLRLPFEAFRPGALGAVKLSHRSLRKNKPDRKKRVKEEKEGKQSNVRPLKSSEILVFGPMKERRALRTGDISSMKIGRGNSYRMLKGSFSTKDMEKFVPLYNKCLNKLSDYVEK